MKTAKSEDVWIPLNQIEIHRTVADSYKLLADDVFLLQDIEQFTRAAVDLLLDMHPIFAIRQRTGVFSISGFRTLNICTLVLPPDSPVPVRLLRGLTESQILDRCLADLFLTPLVFGVRGARTIDALRVHVADHASKWTNLAKCPLNKLATALGLSPTALYYDDKKSKSGQKS
ncbi:hypothetical protein [Citrifermentans bremense]|uniref:hypothetical protein n=1 Tax=Citrifermentans bremense TaxID=60035 RepID=UPI0004792F57|nr:hypothetical protein [Citrifermentans bremense]